jgi:hypothetical protein
MQAADESGARKEKGGELHGSLDSTAADKLAPQVWEVLAQGQRLLIFDLGKLTYVSSAGLTVFLGAYRWLQGVGQVRFTVVLLLLAASQEDDLPALLLVQPLPGGRRLSLRVATLAGLQDALFRSKRGP